MVDYKAKCVSSKPEFNQGVSGISVLSACCLFEKKDTDEIQNQHEKPFSTQQLYVIV